MIVIPLCLQRTGGICPSGQGRTPEDTTKRTHAFKTFSVSHFISLTCNSDDMNVDFLTSPLMLQRAV